MGNKKSGYSVLKYFILGILVCLLCLFLPERTMDLGNGTLLTEKEMRSIVRGRMRQMRELGITEAEEELEEVIFAQWAGYLMRSINLTEEMNQIDSVIYYCIGAGKYDPKTWEWTPSSEQVYMFDMEVFSIGSMYTDFLRGILPLMGDDVRITDMEEDSGGVDEESGTGTQILRFQCNGNPYEFRAEAYYDWMDLKVIDFMNGVLKQEKTGKQLWAASDGGQGIIIFYNTEKWAKQYEKKMGYKLVGSAE